MNLTKNWVPYATITLGAGVLAACTSGGAPYSVTIQASAPTEAAVVRQAGPQAGPQAVPRSLTSATHAVSPGTGAVKKSSGMGSTVALDASATKATPTVGATMGSPVASDTGGTEATPTVDATEGSAAANASVAKAPATAGDAAATSPNATIVTKHASYAVVPFSSLPGWTSGDPRASLAAFMRGCAVLDKRAAWREACQNGQRVDATNEAAVRDFYQRYFTAYRIADRDRQHQGLLTGYYEPTLEGRAVKTGKFTYPVYGVPSDLLYMDSRLLPSLASQNRLGAHVEGRNMVPVAVVSSTDTRRLYVLDLTGGTIDIRDKKLRLRIDGNRIVPYFTRTDIERNGVKAPVLAYVADPVALYAMQIQGNGQIRMGNGEMLALSYADQNGRPFTPRRAVAGTDTPGNTLRVRGIDVALGAPGGAGSADDGEGGARQASNEAGGLTAANRPVDTEAQASNEPKSSLLAGIDDPTAGVSAQAAATTQTRGFVLSNPLAALSAPVPTTGAAVGATLSAAASSGTLSAPSAPSTAMNQWLVRPAPTTAQAAAISQKGAAARAASTARPTATAQTAFANTDPNFVFFRERVARQRDQTHQAGQTNRVAGPIGSLGVPLSPGQSVAVDPRTTPLGAPVFLSSTTSGGNRDTTKDAGRLMVAQDSGNAVQGAVRADYFFGAGARAQDEASQTRRPVEMWVLLPKDMPLTASSKLAVRGDPTAPAAPADCLFADDELCKDN